MASVATRPPALIFASYLHLRATHSMSPTPVSLTCMPHTGFAVVSLAISFYSCLTRCYDTFAKFYPYPPFFSFSYAIFFLESVRTKFMRRFSVACFALMEEKLPMENCYCMPTEQRWLTIRWVGSSFLQTFGGNCCWYDVSGIWKFYQHFVIWL